MDAGEYTALVGASIDDIRQTVRFKVSKPFISEVHNVLKLKNDFNRMK